MGTLTLRLPDDLDEALERESAAFGVSKGDFACEALKRYFRVVEFRALRARLIPLAEAEGIQTDGDVFEALQ